MSSAHSRRNLAVANCLNVIGVLCFLVLSSKKAADLDIIWFLKLLSVYTLFSNFVTAWSFSGIISLSRRNSLISHVFRRSLTLLVAVLSFHVVLVLFGASLIESSTETFYFSVLLAFTTVLPCLLMVGPSADSWINKSFQDGLEYYVVMTSVMSVVGAWLGAFVIPLDWDRWWQVWPISCIYGNQIGYCVGLLLTSKQLLTGVLSKSVQKKV